MARSHVPDDHIDLRHSAFFVEKAVLKEFRSGVDGCVLLFACNDVMAIGAVRAVLAMGLRVPEDISIIGFDNVPMAPYTSPPLTTIAQPIAGFGQTAIQMLLARIGDKDLPAQRQTLPMHLIVRASTAAVRA